MDFYGIDLKGELTRKGTELIAPLIGDAMKDYIQSLLNYKKENDTRYYQSNFGDEFVGDVVSHPDDFFPGSPPMEGRLDLTSLLGHIDGGNSWTSRTSMGTARRHLSAFSLTSDSIKSNILMVSTPG
jgi:hypothetical protein